MSYRTPAFCVTLVAIVYLCGAATAADTQATDPRLDESRAVTAEFAGRLQSALKQALQQEGPSGAIAACRDLAPQIASELSRRTGASIGRTSDRYRNPLNAPQPWQSEVLSDFARSFSNSPGAVPEFFVVDGRGARYMKAIPLAPLCTTCHGATLAPEIAEQLAAEYPHDLATGYHPGELRGAFSVVWPAP